MKTFGNDEKAAFVCAEKTDGTVYARHHSAYGTEYAVGDYPEPELDDTSDEWTVIETPLSDDNPAATQKSRLVISHRETCARCGTICHFSEFEWQRYLEEYRSDTDRGNAGYICLACDRDLEADERDVVEGNNE